MGKIGIKQMGAIVAASVMTLGLVGCWQAANQDQAIASPQTKPKQERIAVKTPSQINPKLVDANTRFGFNLFSEILKKDKTKNVFVSPSSVAIALSMVYNGANGETQKAMARAMALNGMSLQELNQSNADLKALLQNPDPKVQLAIANSLWAKQGVPFKPGFIQRAQQYYSAEVTNLNFSDPKAPSIINSWVSDNTRGKIDSIVDSISPDDVMFLINAIYFKGDWTRPFDKAQTANKPFTRLDGSQKSHPMMSQTGEYRYLETSQFQGVSIPYGENGRMSMVILLPKPGYKLTDFYSSLTAVNWQQWVNQFRTRQGSIQVPRFKLEYDVELKNALSAMGMEVAFDRSQSDLSGISPMQTWIDQVKHKTFVEVNEEGTEAAAVTSIGIRATSIAMDEPFRLVVDRSFFCAIRDNQSGTVLFMGAIVDP